MSKKFEVIEFGDDKDKPTKTYSFEAFAEYQGNEFHKFQRKVQLRNGVKWQTLTVSTKDWPEFAEWMGYVLSEMDATQGFGATNQDDDDIPF